MPPTLLLEPPAIAMSTMIASSRDGNANSASVTSTRIRSSQPPRYPESKPSGTPTTIDRATASRMTSSAVCAPKMTRDSTSSPPDVVPNQCCAEGASRRPKTLPDAVRSALKP